MSANQKKLRIMVMAGGTGGHVFPALAVADELKARGVDIMWLGTRRGLEAEVVPRAGYDISYISVAGLRGNGLLGWLLAPGKLVYALSQGISIIRRFNPAAVLGMGGFVTGPGGVAAWILRRPLLIHEQNAIAGLTNRLLTPLASRIMEGFPGALATPKAIHTGNPVRASILAKLAARGEDSKLHSPVQRVWRMLVVGGSLGAQALNQVVPEALSTMGSEHRPEIWHQTGKKHFDSTVEIYQRHSVTARIDPFIEDMASAYAWADLVLCRAGALTVAELAIAGLASILVPYPHAVDDHQTANAKYLADAGAARLLQQTELTPSLLRQILNELNMSSITAMGKKALTMAKPAATMLVADQCMEAASG